MEIPPFVTMILDRLRLGGYESYVVGGAVRDWLLGRPIADWDVTTSAGFQTILELFQDIRHFSLQHETVTLVDGRVPYEVTAFRGGDRSGSTIEADLSHRDFTIDAMAYEPHEGRLIDPYEGEKDLHRGRIRAVGNPPDRFREDPLRLLRAVRIAVELRFRIEPVTLKTISGMSCLIHTVAVERIRDEFEKIILSEPPSRGLRLMLRTGLLKRLLPELLEGRFVRQPAPHRYTVWGHSMEAVDRIAPDPVLRLAALLHDIGKPRVRKRMGRGGFTGHEQKGARMARDIMDRLRFARGRRDRVVHLVLHHMAFLDYRPDWSDASVRRLMRRVGLNSTDDLIALGRADIAAYGRGNETERLDFLTDLSKRIASLKEEGPVIDTAGLAVDGHKVKDLLGLKAGPEVGRILEELLQRVIDHPEWNTEEKLVQLLRELKLEQKGV